MDYLKWIGVLALVIAVVALFFPKQAQQVVTETLGAGDTTNIGNPWVFTDTVDFSGDMDLGADVQIGTSGTEMSRLNFGTCYFLPYATTIAATATVAVDCQATRNVYNSIANASALTGVSNDDVVNVTLSTTTAMQTYGGLVLNGASASSTSGYITLSIQNLTGTTFTWPIGTNATGSASYVVLDN